MLRRARDLAPIPGTPAELENGYLDHAGTLWLLTREGIGHWAQGRFRKLPPPKEVTDRSLPFAVNAATRERSGRLWVSINGSGVFVFQDSVWTFREILPGRPNWAPVSLYADDQHRVWLAYRDELAMVRGDQTRIFTREDGLEGPLTTVRGGDGMIWVGGEHGLAFLQHDRFNPVHVAAGSDLGSVTAIVPTSNGVWLYGTAGIVYLSQDEVERLGGDPTSRLHRDVFDLVSDLPDAPRFSLSERSFVRGTEDGNGVIWFVTNQGIARVDPRQIARNHLPPPVVFRTVIADDRRYSPHSEIALPPLTRNLRIEYTALSLVVPERVQFRHRLEGWEDVWHEAGDRREVTYTDLRPGRYALRVTASNNDGIWNDVGAALRFTVVPAWYQTTWFRALLIAIALASVFAAYRYRVRRIAAALTARFDERLAERTRIARDLHDTLLQTVQGSKLVADDALASHDVGRLRLAMERLSAWLGQAVNEGRGAVQVLRDSTVIVNDLAESLRAAAEGSGKPPSLSVTVSVRGSSRDFHPIVRDEIYRIGYEAIRNACAHAEATTLAIELEYARDLVLRITDNGLGIDPAVAASGKPGRFGLAGMRERATSIGATLTVDGPPTGTCVTLVVPGSRVFRSDPAQHHSSSR